MLRFVLLQSVLAAGAVHAGALLFQPDTVRYGYSSTPNRYPESTKVRTTSNSSAATLRLKQVVSPVKHGAESAVLFSAPDWREYVYRIDSVVGAGSRFVHHLSRDTNYLPASSWARARFGNAKAPEIQLAPYTAVVLGKFRLGDCEQFPVRAMASSNPAALCRDEPADFLFETGTAGFDTLHVVTNHWTTGVLEQTRPSGNTAGSRYTLDGRRRSWIEPGNFTPSVTVVGGP
jgi:hypothetical protein